jgi:hypothetical protein
VKREGEERRMREGGEWEKEEEEEYIDEPLSSQKICQMGYK